MGKGRELFSRAISSPRFFDGGEWRFPAMAASAENGDVMTRTSPIPMSVRHGIRSRYGSVAT